MKGKIKPSHKFTVARQRCDGIQTKPPANNKRFHTSHLPTIKLQLGLMSSKCKAQLLLIQTYERWWKTKLNFWKLNFVECFEGHNRNWSIPDETGGGRLTCFCICVCVSCLYPYTHKHTHSLHSIVFIKMISAAFLCLLKKDEKKLHDTKVLGQIQSWHHSATSHAPCPTEPSLILMSEMCILHCSISAACACSQLSIPTSNGEPISVCRPQASTPASAAQRQYPSEPTPFPAFIISFMCSRLPHCWLN